MKLKPALIFLLTSLFATAQEAVHYEISFDQATQNVADITVEFEAPATDTLLITMSRSSPGRYALHEFVKNVYDFKVFDAGGDPLTVLRPDPYSWQVLSPSGKINVQYQLYAHRADGTYSDISPQHAHLNIPATFAWVPALSDMPHRVKVNLPESSSWRVSTQLKAENDHTFSAPNLDYFMDSPMEISDHQVRSFDLGPEYGNKTIHFAMHHQGTAEEFDQFFEDVKQIVLREIEVFKAAPDFDFGTYTFLACYMPGVYGDGMEHRNSTVLTSTRSLKQGGMKGNLGTVAHEFFHAWNVERIRPATLEPFDFTEANMSDALWFAEGFTSYYTNLILSRAGIYTEEEYLKSITSTFNYVWNSPALRYFNPIEMSYQAPFVDAATSVDPVNRENTFISYYSYGHMLGLALDLTLRSEQLSLDGYMQELWKTNGNPEIPYTPEHLQNVLANYAGESLAEEFFSRYIYRSEMPDYSALFTPFGITLKQDNPGSATPGVRMDGKEITSTPKLGSAAHSAGLSEGDLIIEVNGVSWTGEKSFVSTIKNAAPGSEFALVINRYGQTINTTLVTIKDDTYSFAIDTEAGETASAKRKLWLK